MLAALDLAKVAFYRYLFDGTLLDVDQATFDFFELEGIFKDPASLAGQPVGSMFEYIGPKGTLRKEIREKGKVHGLEYPVKTLKGNYKCGVHNSYLITDEATGKEAIQVCFYDITELKKAQLAIAEEKERLRVTLKSIGDGVITTDRTGRVMLVNTIAEELTGWTQSEAAGREVTEVFNIVNASTRKKCNNPVDMVLNTKHIVGLANQTKLIARDGTERMIADSGAPILDPKGDVLGVVLVFRDVTEKYKTQASLTRLAEAVNQAAESIVITETDGTISYANPYFEKMTGYNVEEVIGKNVRIMKSGKHNERFYRRLWTQISSGKTWRGIFVNRRKNGELFEEKAVISPVKDSEGNIINYVAVKRDITAERQLETQIHQSQKMAAIGQLAHKITHSFTNVLMIILGNAQLAKNEVANMPEVVQRMEDVIQAANRISGLTAELLAFAHPMPLTLRPMSLDKALTGLSDILQPTIAHDVSLKIALGKTEKVNIDPEHIEQAVIHLAINAVEAMPNGGELLIETRMADLNTEAITRMQMNIPEADRHEGEFAMIRVQDHGKGMTEEEQIRIFEPFFSTKSKKENAGLGLTTVYSIVDRHKGHIVVNSTPGKGTTFRIYLPVVSSESR